MTRCSESDRLQDYLDGELAADAADRLRAHLEGCERCAVELALYRRLFHSLARAPLLDPGTAFTQRVLERVLPSQIRRRHRIAALGWSYAGLVAACLAGLGFAAAQPASHRLLERLSGNASRALIECGLFVINSMSISVLRLADMWRLIDLALLRLAPLGRALAAVVLQPAFLVTITAATAACAAVLWWMRPRSGSASKGAHHVGVLGL